MATKSMDSSGDWGRTSVRQRSGQKLYANWVLPLQAALGGMSGIGKEKKDKKKKNKKKDSGRSSSSSRSRRSRSGSSTTSSGSDSRYPKWDPTKKNSGKVRVTHKQLASLESLRFKRRSDLLNYARRHPGALGALFLCQVRARLQLWPPSSMRELYQMDLGSW